MSAGTDIETILRGIAVPGANCAVRHVGIPPFDTGPIVGICAGAGDADAAPPPTAASTVADAMAPTARIAGLRRNFIGPRFRFTVESVRPAAAIFSSEVSQPRLKRR